VLTAEPSRKSDAIDDDDEERPGNEDLSFAAAPGMPEIDTTALQSPEESKSDDVGDPLVMPFQSSTTPHYGRSKSTRTAHHQQRRSTSNTAAAVQRMTSFAGPFSASASSATTSGGQENGKLSQENSLQIDDLMAETNRRLRRQLTEKEDMVGLLQDEILQLTDRINAMEMHHCSEIEQYKKELAVCSRWGRQSRESTAILSSIEHLRNQLECLKQQADDAHVALNTSLVRLCESVEAVWQTDGGLFEAMEQRLNDDLQFCARGSAARAILSAIAQHRHHVHSQDSCSCVLSLMRS
jgi:Arc/MetJ family transcription regulator